MCGCHLCTETIINATCFCSQWAEGFCYWAVRCFSFPSCSSWGWCHASGLVDCRISMSPYDTPGPEVVMSSSSLSGFLGQPVLKGWSPLPRMYCTCALVFRWQAVLLALLVSPHYLLQLIKQKKKYWWILLFLWIFKQVWMIQTGCFNRHV